MTAAATRAPAYNPAYVEGVLRACVKQFDERATFVDALTGPERFRQRTMANGQQVFDIRSRVNIELQERLAVIYLPYEDPAEVGAAAAASLSGVTGVTFEMTHQGDEVGMRDASSATARSADGDLTYILSVWAAKVPGPQVGAPERDGVHVMLTIPEIRRPR